MKRVFILAIGFILPIQISAQTEEWVARYNGPISNGGASAIAVDGSGNVYVTGWSYSSSSVCDYATIKYNSSGDTMWVRRYNTGSGSANGATAIAVDSSGNVYVTGQSNFSSGDCDYATIKYSNSGIEEWVQRYNGPGNGNDGTTAIALDWSGNVYVTGTSYGGVGTSDDYATIKYNSLGDTMWVRRYNGPGNSSDDAKAIALDDSGNVYVTGNSYDSGTSWDYATIKYDSAGAPMWVRRYNGPADSSDGAFAIAVDGSGNVYVTGQSMGLSTGYLDYATIKYNSSGDTMWVRRYNGQDNDYDRAYKIAVDGNGNVYVTGRSDGSGTGPDYATIKYNSLGDTMLVRGYNGPANGCDEPSAIAVDGSGNVYVTGYSNFSSIAGDDDYATIKYNSSGDTMWVARYSGPGNGYDRATAIVLDRSGCVYVTGWSDFCGTSGGYATIKYCDEAGTEESPAKVGDRLEMLPNPLTALTEIKYELPKSAYVKIELYNLAGRKVATVAEGEQSAGMQVCRLKGNEVRGSGIYFIKFSAEGGSASGGSTESYKETKKVVLMK